MLLPDTFAVKVLMRKRCRAVLRFEKGARNVSNPTKRKAWPAVLTSITSRHKQDVHSEAEGEEGG